VGPVGFMRAAVVALTTFALTSAGCAQRAASVSSAPASAPASAPSRLLGEPAPAFTRPTVQGSVFTTGISAGQVLVVDFMAAYCAPCRRSLPALQALHRRHPRLVVVGVSLDADPDVARWLIARHGLTFPVIHDPQGILAGRYRVTEIPASFVIDHGGRVVWAGNGTQPDGALALAVEAALNGPASPAVPTVAAQR
jgi:cytochrome c biogenesis protein CcmG/thiol:disulfide interchange protein DsbE